MSCCVYSVGIRGVLSSSNTKQSPHWYLIMPFMWAETCSTNGSRIFSKTVVTEGPVLFISLFTVHNGMPNPKKDILRFVVVFLNPCRQNILVSRLGLDNFVPNLLQFTIYQSFYQRRSPSPKFWQRLKINGMWWSLWTYGRQNIKMFWCLQPKLLFEDGWCVWEWNSKSITDNFLEPLVVVLSSLNIYVPGMRAHTCGLILRFIEYSLVWPALLYRCGLSAVSCSWNSDVFLRRKYSITTEHTRWSRKNMHYNWIPQSSSSFARSVRFEPLVRKALLFLPFSLLSFY